MIRLVFLLSVLFNVLFSSQQPITSPRTIVMHHLDDEWIVSLDDQSYWQLKILKKDRAKTWSEWWHQVDPPEWKLDSSFFFDPKTWCSQTTVEIFPNQQEIFPRYRHVFRNTATGETAFAQFIPFGSRYIPKLSFVSKFFEYPQGKPTRITNETFIKNLIIMEEGNVWLVMPSSDKWRSLSQWWMDVQFDQPDPAFIRSLSSWSQGDMIQVYYFKEDTDINTLYEPHSRKSGIYLLENLTKGQLSYARPVSTIELANLYLIYADEQYQAGYSAGERKCSCD